MNALYAKACELELPVNMGANNVIIVLPSRTPAKILKWKVSVGNLISVGRVILLYDSNTGEGKTEPQKIKASQVGTVVKLLAAEGDIIHPGEPLLELEKCSHPTVMKDMCAECGADLRKDDFELHNASVPMVHSVPELKVSIERAQVLGRAEEARLLKQRKLVLLVDLDQTLIHTTNDDILPHIKDVHHFQLHGAGSAWYHTRLRPGTHKFLENMSHLYELHICTFGSRTYAHAIAAILDHSKKFFSHRILSRDECFNPNTKTANLKALFPCGDNLVCIIDDREDVWNHAPNLVHVRPYHFFQHTGDINAPSCLSETSDYPPEESVGALSEENQNALQKSSSSKTQDDTTKEEEAEDNEEENYMILGHEVCVEEMDLCQKGGDEREVNNDSNCTKDARPDAEGQAQKNCRFKDEGGGEMAEEDVIKNEGEKSDTKAKDDAADDLKLKNDKGGAADEGKDPQKEIYQKEPATEDELLELDDHDDYLLHLEDILITIHRAFYQIYDQSPDVPDMKSVVPYVRRKVLQGVRLCFSGVVPIGVPLEASRVYAVARSLGAEITNELVLQEEGSNCREFEENSRGEKFPSSVITKRKNESSKSSDNEEMSMTSSLSSNDLQNRKKPTTHLVAARLGTYKVNLGKRVKSSKLHIVTPDWLWCCAERWERVDERLFPLNKSTSVDYSRKFKNIFGEVTLRPKEVEVKDSAKTVVIGSKSTEENSIPVEVKPTAAPVISSSGSNGNDPMSSSAFATYNPVTGKRVRKEGQTTTTVEERKRTPSGRFMDTINPLLSFSSEDLANMEDEVEEGLFDDEEDETESEVEGVRQEEEGPDLDVKESIDAEEKNVVKLSEEEAGKNNRKRKSSYISSSEDKEGAEEGGDTAKHFSSEDQVKDWDYDESLELEDGDDDEDDDKDWSMMGAALEREIMADEIE